MGSPQPERKNVRAEVIISGRVQGVWFRASTVKTARSLGLEGWVRNRSDGRVEAVFEGPSDVVRRAVSWCHDGPPAARVEGVAVDWTEATGEFAGFTMRW